MTIYEIDEFGHAWVEKIVEQTDDSYRTHSFINDPANLLKIF